MKKIIGILIALLLLSGSYLLVSANGGPHGGYTATTDACAGCHRTHTAIGPRLLITNSTYGLCMSCHGSSAAGANTNVEDGVYLVSRDDTVTNEDHGAANTPDGSPLLGGGFLYYRGEAVTSSHDMGDSASLLAWGNEVARGDSAAIVDMEFSCASCHDPHGSPNYRLIKTEVNGVAVQVSQVDENAKDYDTEQWGAGTSDLCAACHRAYHETALGSGTDSAVLTFGGGFTHRVDMNFSYRSNQNPETTGFTDVEGVTVRVPLAQSGSGDLVVCMTCHIPHGSSAEMFGNANGAGLPGETSAADSALLRLDNRGVCQACHQK